MHHFYTHIARHIGLLGICAISTPLNAEFVVSHHKVANPRYEIRVLTLSLEKTLEEYGPYRLAQAKTGVTHSRFIETMRKNQYVNQIRSLSYDKALIQQNLNYIPIPLYRGLLSYRVCFTSKDKLNDIRNIKTSTDLKTFSQGVGVGWADKKILEFHGFTVYENVTKENLFRMVSLGRIDLFCRGVGEALSAYEMYSNIENLALDQSIALYYPMPNFFYTNANNTVLIERVSLGLKRAYEDGDLIKLWRKNFEDSINFSNLGKRKIFKFENPLLRDINDSFKKYFYMIEK